MVSSMGTFAVCSRHALARGAPIALLGGLLALAQWAFAEPSHRWLELAALGVPLAVVLATVALFPVFATDGRARELVVRANGGAFRGLAAAVAGGSIATVACLVSTFLLASPTLPVPRVHVDLEVAGRPGLDATHPELTFALPMPCSEVRLRAIALRPDGALEATRIAIEVDGAPVPGGEVAIAGDRQLVRVPLDGRRAERLVVRRLSGTLPLWFDRGAAVAIAAEPSNRALGCVFAALVTSLPAFVALAVLALLAPFLRVSSALVVGTAIVLLQTVGRLGPAEATLAMCERGRWPVAEPVFWPCVASLATGFLAMIAAMATHAERRR